MLDDKARELGRMIGQSAEYQAVKRSSDALNADREAVALLQRMEQIRVDAQSMIERGQEPTRAMQDEIDDVMNTLQPNASYQRAIAAQENFDKLMLQVNNWIMDGIKKGSASPIITLG